jgi:hypothetical protein
VGGSLISEMLSGFLFLFIIIMNLVSERFGHETFSDLDSDAKLQKINNDPKKFKTSVILMLIENISIICLALTLFIAFSSYNLIIGVVWAIARTGEGLIQIYNKNDNWALLNVARQYANTSGVEKTKLINIGRNILRTKNTVFTFAQVLFSIGTLAYSTLFAIYGVIPELIGWLGIVASLLYGFGSAIKLVKTNIKGLWNLGGLLILVFELALGGWLLVSSLF